VIFDAVTEKILSRRYHKFFNIGELEETQEDNIDISQPHVILEKLDGSLVAPMLLDGKVVFGTKAGITEMSLAVEKFFLLTCGIDYANFCREWLLNDHTPLFEWCSPMHPIVIPYSVDGLILTAIRNNITGEYIKYAEMVEIANNAKIPVVKAIVHAEGNNVAGILQQARKLENIEGYIMRFDSGEMYKVKSEWYFNASKLRATMLDMTERNLWLLALDNKLDDCQAFGVGDLADKYVAYGEQLWLALTEASKEMHAEFLKLSDSASTRKDFVFALQKRNDVNDAERQIYLRVYGKNDVTPEVILEEMVANIKKGCTTVPRCENFKKLWAPDLIFPTAT